MGDRKKQVVRDLEVRQEDSRGALTRGAWLWVARRGEVFEIETSVLPYTQDVREVLAPLGFYYDSSTGCYRATVQTGDDLLIRKIGGVVLALLAREIQ